MQQLYIVSHNDKIQLDALLEILNEKISKIPNDPKLSELQTSLIATYNKI